MRTNRENVHYLETMASKKVLLTRIALVVTATLLVWRVYEDSDTPSRESELLRRLEDENKACLVRKGLDSSEVLGGDLTYSTLNCPLGEEAYPRDLCTVHVIYLNHTERRFVARTPTQTTSG